MSEQKVLIIAYYWPPSGGSGVQRWLKFVKYLPQHGWTPYVFTPENPSFAVRDESLLNDVPAEAEVLHFPIWEPYEAFLALSKVAGGTPKAAKPTDLVSTGKRSLFQRLSTWVRGNLFIPDPRMFWVRPSVKFLAEFLKANNIRTIVTTGPPHSLHLIGLKLKQRDPSLHWLADFRDPWSEWGFLDTLKVGAWARRRHKKLERSVLQQADEVITITPFYVRQFSTLGGRPVNLLTNGYDEDDFKDLVLTRPPRFTIRHIGIVNEKCDPRPFMEAVRTAMRVEPEFAANTQVEFIGEVHPQFKAYVQASPELNRITRFPGSVPHKELLKIYGSSSMLVLVLTGYKDAEGYMPGKLFEYLATGLPVLGVGPEQGDAANLLRESGAGQMLDGNRQDQLFGVLMREFVVWQKQGSATQVSRNDYSAYSRRAITGKLTQLFKV
jgi:glycosyltransferase involved in cell wall biosynthesis